MCKREKEIESAKKKFWFCVTLFIVNCFVISEVYVLYKSPIIVLRFTLVCWPDLMAALSRFCEVNVYVLVEFCDCNTVA